MTTPEPSTPQEASIQPNPVRRRRRRLGLSMQELADLAGVGRETLSALESGRTRHPMPETARSLERVFKMKPDSLTKEVLAWRASMNPKFTVRQSAILQLPPLVVRKYASFAAWRHDLGLTRTSLAALVGTPHRSVFAYEAGEMQAFPYRLSVALMGTLFLTDEYMEALMSLPPSDAKTAAREALPAPSPRAKRAAQQASKQVRELFDDEETTK